MIKRCVNCVRSNTEWQSLWVHQRDRLILKIKAVESERWCWFLDLESERCHAIECHISTCNSFFIIRNLSVELRVKIRVISAFETWENKKTVWNEHLKAHRNFIAGTFPAADIMFWRLSVKKYGFGWMHKEIRINIENYFNTFMILNYSSTWAEAFLKHSQVRNNLMPMSSHPKWWVLTETEIK